jgi:hypothetical protein
LIFLTLTSQFIIIVHGSQLPLIYTALNASSVSTDGVTRNPGSSDPSSHVNSLVPNTFHIMDKMHLHPSLAANGILNPDTSSVKDTEYPRPLGIQVPVPALRDLELPIPPLSIATLSLGNPRIGSRKGRGRGSNGGRGVENSANPPDLPDGTFCSKTFSNGTFLAKMFVEEYATYLHRYVMKLHMCMKSDDRSVNSFLFCVAVSLTLVALVLILVLLFDYWLTD